VAFVAAAVALVLSGFLASASPQEPSLSSAAAAQVEIAPPDVVQELELVDGSRLFGRVERVEAGIVVFRTLAGVVIQVPRLDVVAAREAKGRVRDGRFLPADPNETRLLFAPTARSLPARHGYLGVYEFLLPFVQAGVTDRVSIGGGTPLVFGVGSGHPAWLTPKVQLYGGDRAQVAAGLIHFFNIDEDGDGGGAGLAYGVTTLGPSDRAITVGAGWAYDGGGSDDGSVVVMIGGEHRVRQNLKIITENYVFDGGAIVSLGVRFIGDHLSADLGLFTPVVDGEVPVALPIVNFVWTFGR
jgi:hypothetical protein